MEYMKIILEIMNQLMKKYDLKIFHILEEFDEEQSNEILINLCNFTNSINLKNDVKSDNTINFPSPGINSPLRYSTILLCKIYIYI